MTEEQLQQATEIHKQISKTEKAKENLVVLQSQIQGTRTIISIGGKSAKVISADLSDFIDSQITKADNRIANLEEDFNAI